MDRRKFFGKLVGCAAAIAALWAKPEFASGGYVNADEYKYVGGGGWVRLPPGSELQRVWVNERPVTTIIEIAPVSLTQEQLRQLTVAWNRTRMEERYR